jgi:serine/threonine-protein kinase
MAVLPPGTVLGDRFVLHGVVGQGGSATVYLAEDQLRRTRVALKVVHAHLAADPDVRRRLQREVEAASLLRSPGVLAPHDLHAFPEQGGRLALSMPFHGGHTLTEHVHLHGPLSADALRALGQRLAAALADAHGHGVLHRDVTPANIMLQDGPHDAVLTDFGLARTQLSATTRSTGLLGTAGYAAPEVYGGDRADPRSDLYGLGACLYLAAAGRPPFDTANPMAALQAQLGDGWTPLAELRPDLPPELCGAIESLLRVDPGARPDGAAEVRELLAGRALPPPAPVAPAALPNLRRQHLPPGPWTVVVKESGHDRHRRQELRRRHRGRRSTENELHRIGAELVRGLKDVIGLKDHEDSPEQQLTERVAAEAGLRPGQLQTSAVLFDRRFRLVDRTDEETARRLCSAAEALGFTAKALRIDRPRAWLDLVAQYFWVIIAGGWTAFPFLTALVGEVYEPAAGPTALVLILTMTLLSIVLPVFASARGRVDGKARELPAAFRADLTTALTPGVEATGRYAIAAEATASLSTGPPVEASQPAPTTPSRADGLLARALGALDALDATILEKDADLPEPALVDLRATAKDLRRTAHDLADELRDIENALLEHDGGTTEAATLRSRLDRLSTLDRAGEAVDRRELASLQRALDAHARELATIDALESQLTTTTARMLELCSTASQARRELLAGDAQDRHSADEAVARLRRELAAARAAVRER